MWDAPLAIASTSEAAAVLVRASPEAWAESNLGEFYRQQHYRRGPEDSSESAVAIAQQDMNRSRIVVIGSAESMSSEWSERGIGGNDRIFVSSLLWVLGRDLQLASQDKRPEYLRLLMTSNQLQSAFFWCVVVGPLFLALFGTALWWWRRREN